MIRITKTEWNRLKKHGYATMIKGKTYAMMNGGLVPVEIVK